ncbi:LLM class F420-dependent oxidoreductase [Actinoallomurus vinaceus]|uniref:LLM class F420-dependent oxidoreductase n=1 Tax=Actinoallomurus vinaceus TaxID=1080074 RepID=A0ABP8USC4_9ACTN
MRLGVNVTHMDPAIGLAAERLGYRLALVPEGFRADAVSVLGWLAARTERIRLSAILQIPVRTPAMTAMTAATLHTLSGGRFELGLGISNAYATETWHGVSFDRPLQRTGEYLEIVRMALRGEEVRYSGTHYQVPSPGAPGEGFRMPAVDLPVSLAAVGPRNLELAGRHCDGYIGVFASPERVAEVLPHAWVGRARAGRPRQSFQVTLSAGLSVGADLEAAARPLRPHAARFMSLGHRERNVYYRLAERMGFGRAAAEVQDRHAAGDLAGAAAAVPFEFVDATGLIGPPERIARRIEAYAAAGVTTLALTPYGADADARTRALAVAAEALDRTGVPA